MWLLSLPALQPRSCSRAMKAVGVVEASCEEIFELVMGMDGTRFEWVTNTSSEFPNLTEDFCHYCHKASGLKLIDLIDWCENSLSKKKKRRKKQNKGESIKEKEIRLASIETCPFSSTMTVECNESYLTIILWCSHFAIWHLELYFGLPWFWAQGLEVVRPLYHLFRF